MSIVIKLHAAVNAAVGVVAPIYGVSIGRKDDKATWRIDFKDEATPEQRAAAAEVLTSFDAQKVLHNAAIDAQIAELESASGGYIRGVREFMLAQAAETKRLGGADFMPSRGMQNVKALDDQIRALRGQRLP